MVNGRNWLTLRRKDGESVRVTTAGGETLWITAHDIVGGYVRLSFSAEKEVKVLRNELLPEGERLADMPQ